MNVPVAVPQRREIQTVVDAVPILDTARFEHMQRIAAVMARSTMIPETLRCEGPKERRTDLPFEQILSNCFLVVNQAARWGMDPFAVISCCSVVHGRLSYEGKLVSAVLDAKLGISLHHHFIGNPHGEDYRIYLSDQPFTDEIIRELTPGFSKNGWRVFDGSVAEWKTTGAGSPWSAKNYKRMLIYRGTRDWTRIYVSALMLGVYSDDEMLDLMEDARARRATPVATLSLADRLSAAKTSGSEGFSHDHVTRETGGQTQDSQTATEAANHSKTQHDATPHEQEILRTENSATDAHRDPDRTETVDHTNAGGDDASLAGKTGQVGEKPATDSNSSEQNRSPQDGAETDGPAAEILPPAAAGQQSESSASPSPEADEGGDGVDEVMPSAPSLPEGWEITYAAALRRAQKKDSLAKYAAEYWKQYGGWPAHKDGEHGPTASAIYNAFANNFGNKDAIERDLREIF